MKWKVKRLAAEATTLVMNYFQSISITELFDKCRSILSVCVPKESILSKCTICMHYMQSEAQQYPIGLVNIYTLLTVPATFLLKDEKVVFSLPHSSVHKNESIMLAEFLHQSRFIFVSLIVADHLQNGQK